MATLSYKKRKAMPKKQFAIKSKKTKKNPAGRGGYPINDRAHAKNALARVAQNGTPEEKRMVHAAVMKKYPDMMKGKIGKSMKALHRSMA